MREQVLAAFYAPTRRATALAIALIVATFVVGTWLVYATGGAKFAVLHVMYLPIIFTALMFGAPGGICAGVAAGLLIGPYMPIDVVSGEPQQLQNWLYRTAFFSLVGLVVGLGSSLLRRQLKMLAWLNDHDAPTGMLNRAGLLKELRRMIERGNGRDGPFLIVLQLNNLLDIQNALGPDFGEQLLAQVCERGRRVVPSRVPIAMIQPDRFVTVFETAADSVELRRQIEAKIREPYKIGEVPVYIDFGIGAAEIPSHARSAEELLQKASIAMHTTVQRKQPFFVYDSAADHTSRDNLILMGSIPGALANNEFVLWHQAKFDVEKRQVVGTEALLRWRHPKRGLVPPGKFIPQVEETALINDLTYWVIDAALAETGAWMELGYTMGVAINLSVRNLRDRALIDRLHQATDRHCVSPEQVELEITESAVMHDHEHCRDLIARLRDRGYRVSIDDFGTGQSSLAYLKTLPVNALKIDQTFVKNLATDANDRKIVRSILRLAHSLDLDSVAEGVEDEAALALLRDWHCDYAQGFALHRPAPFPDLLAWIEDLHRPAEQMRAAAGGDLRAHWG
jgi:diguanylate cyclase